MLTVENPRTFDFANIPLPECAQGNCLDTYFTLKIFEILYEDLETLNSIKVFQDIMSPAISMFADIEYSGLDVSPEVLEDLGIQLEDKIGLIKIGINRLIKST